MIENNDFPSYDIGEQFEEIYPKDLVDDWLQRCMDDTPEWNDTMWEKWFEKWFSQFRITETVK